MLLDELQSLLEASREDITKSSWGRPLLVYHATGAEFVEFRTEGKTNGVGIYFAPSKRAAESINVRPNNVKKVIKAYVSLQNPKIVSADTGESSFVSADDRKRLYKEGYDGIISKLGDGSVWEVVALKSSQVKSVDNRGTFDIDTGNIYERRGLSVKPTKEMVDWFEKRTKEHIDRVKKALDIISKGVSDLDHDELMRRGQDHDKSKYSSHEREPYIWLSWYYKCKSEGKSFSYPNGVEDQITKATYHHIKNNRHHTQSHDSTLEMTKEDLAEMVADWVAMDWELGGNTRKWADQNIGKKFQFSDDQKSFIYKLIDLFDNTD